LKAARGIESLSQFLVQFELGFEPAEMQFFVCKDLLDEIASGGVVSGCGRLGRSVELGFVLRCSPMSLSRTSRRVAPMFGASIVNAGLPPSSTIRFRSVWIVTGLIASPAAHHVSETLETPSLGESDMGLCCA